MGGRRLRAVIYARFSSHNQDEISIVDQVAVNTSFIESIGADLVGVYADEAKTGTNDKRDDFQRMMRDAKEDIYDIVVIWHTNRLHRNMLNSFVMLAELFKYDKDFRSSTQPELNDPNSSTRLIMYAMHTWKDEDYSKGLSADVKRGFYSEKALACHPLGELRYGYDIAGARIDDKGKFHPGDHYEINKHEAKAVRAMFRMRARGMAWTAIAETLNAQGYRNKYGRPITDAMVAGIVRNEAYKGVYVFGDVRIEDGIPRIISDAEWDAAQDGNRRHKVKHRKHVYIKPKMVFGDLEVVELIDKRNHHTRWLCKCNVCGNTKIEWATRLTSGRAKDCGCLSGDGRCRDERGRFA